MIMIDVYKDMDVMNTIEQIAKMSCDKDDKIGIICALGTDRKMRGVIPVNCLLRPYHRMRILNKLCHIYDIIPKGTWLCAIHSNDYQSFKLYKLHIESDDHDGISIFEDTKCDMCNIIEICDSLIDAYDDEIPEILNKYFG